MIVDVFCGWSERVGGRSSIWEIADAIAGIGVSGHMPVVRRHTCGDDLRPFLASPPAAAVPQSKRMWVVYSYGCARLWNDLHDLLATGHWQPTTPFDHLVIIAGVPRFWDVQFEISDARATCFSPRDFCLPQSQPIKNPSGSFQNRFIDGVDHSSIVPAVTGEVLEIARFLSEQEKRS